MLRLLLVEDDDMLAEGLDFALRKEGFGCERAASLSEARERLLGADYDLLLLDLMLPDGSGYTLCREVRARSTVPIVFLTACDDEVQVVQGLELGGDDYIAKPFRLGELISRIKANLRRSGQAGASRETLRSGVVELLPLEARALKRGVPMELSPIEFRLLHHLMRHPGQVMTREQLLDKLWDGQGDYVDDNTLSVNIRRLREKLEDNASAPTFILTVRGLGYKWRSEESGHA